MAKKKSKRKPAVVTKAHAKSAAKKLASYAKQQSKIVAKKVAKKSAGYAVKAKNKSIALGKSGLAKFRKRFGI